MKEKESVEKWVASVENASKSSIDEVRFVLLDQSNAHFER